MAEGEDGEPSTPPTALIYSYVTGCKGAAGPGRAAVTTPR